jgi:hypothetical protein
LLVDICRDDVEKLFWDIGTKFGEIVFLFVVCDRSGEETDGLKGYSFCGSGDHLLIWGIVDTTKLFCSLSLCTILVNVFGSRGRDVR